ncbi:hypothetical protein SADUNF_Sadunf15G0043300 [Salix dunnii]|uniref:Uncharacterized protein n=1 Tax=Salix dunnii TaxID=1413687 RepID=A0A835MID4_9ROSI|nr:hypothetical protein SADUNF_Sadunf15G0043300 [Salix dunnii]
MEAKHMRKKISDDGVDDTWMGNTINCRYSLLTLALEVICHLIYPFRWQLVKRSECLVKEQGVHNSKQYWMHSSYDFYYTWCNKPLHWERLRPLFLMFFMVTFASFLCYKITYFEPFLDALLGVGSNMRDSIYANISHPSLYFQSFCGSTFVDQILQQYNFTYVFKGAHCEAHVTHPIQRRHRVTHATYPVQRCPPCNTGAFKEFKVGQSNDDGLHIDMSTKCLIVFILYHYYQIEVYFFSRSCQNYIGKE